MKKHFIGMLMILFAGLGYNANAQQAPHLPEASSTQTITQDFGVGKISITYSRPNVKGREIFGGLTPYGQVWRTGANSATSIDFSENVIIEGNKVPAGTYALFTIPGKDEWTIILNKTVKQWGAYTYKEADDFLRFKVKPTTVSEKVETFTIQFANETPKSTDLSLVWDHTAVNIYLLTDDEAQISANIDELMKGDKKPYQNVIQYYYDNNKDMNKALGWVLEAEKGGAATWQKPWEARIRLKLGDKPGALAAAQEGLKVAQAAKNDEYVQMNQALITEAGK